MRAVDRFERFGQKVYNGQDVLKNHILNHYPIHLTDNTDDYSILEKYNTDFVWIVDKSIETLRSFPWWFKPTEKDAIHIFPYVYKASKRVKSWNKVKLVPTKIVTDKTITHNHICGEYDVYFGKENFDIFFGGKTDTGTWDQLKERFPEARAVSCLSEASELSTTGMFWIVPDDVIISDFFKFSYAPDDWSHEFTHVFGNGSKDNRDGIALFPKSYQPTDREKQYRYYANKKELNIIASRPRPYDKFYLKNYQDYLDAIQTSKTDLFWFIPADVDVVEDFNFDLYFSYQNQYDRNINHVFLNNDSYDGVALFSKNSPVTEKEFNHRFYANKKEWDIIASHPKKYDQFVINNYRDYQYAKQNSTTEMFWGIPSDVELKNDLTLYFSHHNQYDRNITHVFLNGKHYDGVVLYSKNVEIFEKEVEHRFYVNKKEHKVLYSQPQPFEYFEIDSYKDYLNAIKTSKTDLFWFGSKNIAVEKKLIKTFYISHHELVDRNQNHAFEHKVDNDVLYNGLLLVSKNKILTEKEVEHRFPVERKEWKILGSTQTIYDVFEIDTYDEYLNALETSTTEMFWMSSRNISAQIPDIYFSHDNEYDRKQNHAFIHQVGDQKLYNGLFLCSKYKPLTEREILYRHIIDRKEWNIVGSTNLKYNQFKVNNYADYLSALKESSTELFWGIPTDVNVNYDFDLYFTHDNEYDRKTNHIMLNGEHRDGIVLFSKHSPVTEKEVENRFYVNKKDWDIVASTPKQYNLFVIETYNDYLDALEKSETEMFWATTNNIKIKSDFDLSLYFPYYNQFDRSINHVFQHQVGDEFLYEGLFLLSKRATLTEKEIEHRHIVKRKEWNVVASKPVVYDKFVINTYDDYVEAQKLSKTDMFWMVPPEVIVNNDFDFDLYFPHRDQFEKNICHVFMNGTAYDGISLIPRKMNISEREINMRFFANKKQYNVIASYPAPYDIVFISSDEDDADKNYQTLLDRFPRAKRIHGVKGIHQAHIEAAKQCSTDMFWVVDADAEIIPKFNFDYYVPSYDPDSKKTVHVWKAQNPINSLVYGYGAVKLLPRELTLNMDTSKPDMTTSISPYFKSINRISNITRFNTDPFSTWRSAFRECVKLASKTINGQMDEETEFRLNIWCTKGKDKEFGTYCIAGANAGAAYGKENQNNKEALNKINDFEWLKDQFNQSTHSKA